VLAVLPADIPVSIGTPSLSLAAQLGPQAFVHRVADAVRLVLRTG
jgi:hypothetical protein